tara:strand:+ start:204 stop:809 length:606 start_codon:yes stop_codon:yes gene_type:complete
MRAFDYQTATASASGHVGSHRWQFACWRRTFFLVELIRRLRDVDAKIAIDSSGAALKAAVEVGVDLAKPNVHELEELLDTKFDNFQATLDAARELCRERIPNLIVSLGDEGALFLADEAELMASAPPVKVISTVGAGDSLLAGYLQGILRGDTPPDCARMATVYAWSRLESLVSALPANDVLTQRLARVTVQPIAPYNPKA